MKTMKNVGGIDRVARIVIGLALVLVAVVPSTIQTAWGWIGVVPLATALIGWCPAYTLLGIRTCKAPEPKGGHHAGAA
jgi:hypothetical protein